MSTDAERLAKLKAKLDAKPDIVALEKEYDEACEKYCKAMDAYEAERDKFEEVERRFIYWKNRQ